MAKPKLISEMVGEQTYWYLAPPKTATAGTHLLPAYDEFIISYKDRSAALTFEKQNKAVSDNGVFRPMVVNGEVIGIWAIAMKSLGRLRDSADRNTLQPFWLTLAKNPSRSSLNACGHSQLTA